VVCGELFEGRPDALVCGQECRAVQNAELRRQRRLVA
jgi:predicted nucleic acid-binding Zn ribbon protein